MSTTEHRVLMLAVDNTDDDVRACQWLIDNLLRAGDSVHIVHIIPRFTNLSPGPMDTLLVANQQADYDKMILEAETFIRSRFTPLFKDKVDQDPIVHLVKGELDTEGCGKAICSKADELSPTAVVMAKHTKGVLHQWVIGSVCKYCTTNCKWTVVISHTA